jgi:hypothetical protein
MLARVATIPIECHKADFFELDKQKNHKTLMTPLYPKYDSAPRNTVFGNHVGTSLRAIASSVGTISVV